MAEQQFLNKANQIYRLIGLVVILVLVLTAVWATPVGAGNGIKVSGAPAPSIPSNPLAPLSVRSFNVPLPQAAQVAQPPVPNQGGTCVSGYLIDSYHQRLGLGWSITLTPQEGAAQTTTTDEDGAFSFTQLVAGTYTVELKMNEGFRAFTPTSFPVTLNGVGDGCAQVRFKVEALPCIQVVKLDAGGKVNGQMPGLPGWSFTATQDNTVLDATTDGQGLAYFYNLTPGTWLVTEEEKNGWRPASGYGSTLELNLVAPQTPGICQVATFVNQQVQDACVIGQKVDTADRPVEGWKIEVTRDDGTQAPASGVTDATGQVVFDHLALGSWTVTEETREWWNPAGPTSVSVELTRPGYCQVVKFINEPLGCVDGYKINHLEQGLPGWKINATNADTGQQFSTVTDSTGYFQFNELSLGSWVVSEDLQPGWEPVTAPEFTVSVTEPFICTTVRFKNRTPFACLDVFKRDQIDNAGLPGWTITLQPAYGGEPVTGITDGTGWVRFNELTPGTYTVKEDVLPGWTATTPEQVTVDLAATGTCAVLNFVNIQTHMIPPEQPTVNETTVKDKAGHAACPLYYRVQPGNTLWGIGQWFGVPVSAIARVNHIKNPSLIYPGTRLCIPLGDP